MSGLWIISDSVNFLVFIGIEEEEATKLKNKSIPKQISGLGKNFVLLWIKPSNNVTPKDNILQDVVKVTTVV